MVRPERWALVHAQVGQGAEQVREDVQGQQVEREVHFTDSVLFASKLGESHNARYL